MITSYKKQQYQDQVFAEMNQSLNLTYYSQREDAQNSPISYEQLKNKYQALKKEIQSIKSTYQNDQNQFRNRKSQLELAKQTIEKFKKKQLEVQKSEEQYKKKYEKLQTTLNEEKNKEFYSLKEDHQKFKNEMNKKLKELNLLLSTKQQNQREMTQKMISLKEENKLLKLKEEELNQQITELNQREDIFKSSLPEQSILMLPEQSTIYPIKQRVLLLKSEADLINENRSLKFQIEELQKKIKEKEQMSAKKENGLLKSIQKYESLKVNEGQNQKQLSEIAKLKAKKQQSALLQPKNHNIDDEDTCNPPSYLTANKGIFLTLQKHYGSLPQKQKALFLSFLSCYAQQKFDRQAEISQLYELGQ